VPHGPPRVIPAGSLPFISFATRRAQACCDQAVAASPCGDAQHGAVVPMLAWSTEVCTKSICPPMLCQLGARRARDNAEGSSRCRVASRVPERKTSFGVARTRRHSIPYRSPMIVGAAGQARPDLGTTSSPRRCGFVSERAAPLTRPDLQGRAAIDRSVASRTAEVQTRPRRTVKLAKAPCSLYGEADLGQGGHNVSPATAPPPPSRAKYIAVVV